MERPVCLGLDTSDAEALVVRQIIVIMIYVEIIASVGAGTLFATRRFSEINTAPQELGVCESTSKKGYFRLRVCVCVVERWLILTLL